MSNRLAPAQIRAARGALDWSMLSLAKAAGLSVSTVKRLETAGRPSGPDDAHAAVRAALEAAGVRFLDDGGDGGDGWSMRLGGRRDGRTPADEAAG